MKKMEKYYENYWIKPEEALPYEDTTTARRVQLLLEAVGRNKYVLDVGCGDGLIAAQIANAGNKVVGIDISKNALATAEKKYPQIRFICSSAEEEYPFKDEEFDVIFGGEIMEHLADTQTAFSEMNRVLKKDGLLILTLPIHNMAKNIIICLYKFDEHFEPGGPHLRFYTKTSLKKVLEKNDFKIVKMKGVGRFWPLNKGIFIVAKK